MFRHYAQTTAILSGHHCVDCKTINCSARSSNDIAQKLANDQLLFCALSSSLCSFRISSSPMRVIVTSCPWFSRPHWQHDRQDRASVFLPCRWMMNSCIHSNHVAIWPSSSLKFFNQVRVPWSVQRVNCRPRRKWWKYLVNTSTSLLVTQYLLGQHMLPALLITLR